MQQISWVFLNISSYYKINTIIAQMSTSSGYVSTININLSHFTEELLYQWILRFLDTISLSRASTRSLSYPVPSNFWISLSPPPSWGIFFPWIKELEAHKYSSIFLFLLLNNYLGSTQINLMNCSCGMKEPKPVTSHHKYQGFPILSFMKNGNLKDQMNIVGGTE